MKGTQQALTPLESNLLKQAQKDREEAQKKQKEGLHEESKKLFEKAELSEKAVLQFSQKPTEDDQENKNPGVTPLETPLPTQDNPPASSSSSSSTAAQQSSAPNQKRKKDLGAHLTKFFKEAIPVVKKIASTDGQEREQGLRRASQFFEEEAERQKKRNRKNNTSSSTASSSSTSSNSLAGSS